MMQENEVLDLPPTTPTPTTGTEDEQAQVVQTQEESPPTSVDSSQPEPAQPPASPDDTLRAENERLRAENEQAQQRHIQSQLDGAERDYAQALITRQGVDATEANRRAASERQALERDLNREAEVERAFTDQRDAYTNAVSIAEEHNLSMADLKVLVQMSTPDDMRRYASLLARQNRTDQVVADNIRAPAAQMDTAQGGVEGVSSDTNAAEFGAGRRNTQEAAKQAFQSVKFIPGIEQRYGERYG